MIACLLFAHLVAYATAVVIRKLISKEYGLSTISSQKIYTHFGLTFLPLAITAIFARNITFWGSWGTAFIDVLYYTFTDFPFGYGDISPEPILSIMHQYVIKNVANLHWLHWISLCCITGLCACIS